MDRAYLEVTSAFCDSLKVPLQRLEDSLQESVSEIRITADAPVRITRHGTSFYLQKDGKLTKDSKANCIIPTKTGLEQSLLTLCDYSVHSHMQELRQGFLTIKGGHRIGVSGFAVYDENGSIKSFKRITSYVARIARSYGGTGDEVAALLWTKPVGILIGSEPSGGKTTLLCDLIRTLSEQYAIAVVDERMELGDRLSGVTASLLSGIKKAEGIMLAIRSLAPQLVFCDEIGDKADLEALSWAMNCGVPLITTIHASNMEELLRRKAGQSLIESGAFSYVVFLQGRTAPGKVKEVISLDTLKDDGHCDDYRQRRNVWAMAGR